MYIKTTPSTDGKKEYHFPDTEEGRKLLLTLRNQMLEEGIPFEIPSDTPLVIRVSESGIRFIEWAVSKMRDESNNGQDQ